MRENNADNTEEIGKLDKFANSVDYSFQTYVKQNNNRIQQLETKVDIHGKEITKIENDVEVKFGSKNLLQFGSLGGGYDKED